MSRVERVSYRSGFVKRLRESRHLPAITFEAADLSEDVVALVDVTSWPFTQTRGAPGYATRVLLPKPRRNRTVAGFAPAAHVLVDTVLVARTRNRNSQHDRMRCPMAQGGSARWPETREGPLQCEARKPGRARECAGEMHPEVVDAGGTTVGVV